MNCDSQEEVYVLMILVQWHLPLRASALRRFGRHARGVDSTCWHISASEARRSRGIAQVRACGLKAWW